ncbi:MAG: crossover junction endodeoxyribonuclease RuvC [Actinomycetota bacterium]|nr:crossover junction endodeoxyribonuclease RuvC [Actinomycetota bacterium]
MKVIGIDPGLVTMGYAVVAREGGKLIPVAHGVFRTPPSLAHGERLALLRTQLLDVIGVHRPDEAAIERLFFNANVRTAMAVGQASGVAMATLAEAGLEAAQYTPPQVKQSVVGVGSASKHQVQTMVASLLSLPSAPYPADAADACALAICHLNTARLGRAIDRASGTTAARRLAGPRGARVS